MIITAQPFLNEVERLLIKFETLKGAVDLHIVAESPVTFTGVNKAMHFKLNQHLFKDYPVHYIDLSDLPESRAMKADPWAMEEAQRQATLKEIKKIDPEIVIFGDADETPKPEVIEKFRSLNCHTANLEMDMLLFYFNRIDSTPWRYQRICKFQGRVCDRGNWNHPMITDAGWHFQYMGGKQTLLDKVNSSSHAMEVGGRNFYQAVSRGEKPGLEACSEYPEEKLPAYVRENRERFSEWFA
jgi:beta-1,4-mannosyl-glycoprotein beta-1,4-N-acetylglucosaminyltransferase